MTERTAETKSRRAMRPERVLAVGFLALIVLGTALLALPFATQDGRSIGVFNALFTATSAVCVTGLVVVDTATTFSLFGQAVLLLLIQCGGLGFMVFATLIMVAMGRKITLRDRMLIRESMNASSMSGLVRLTKVYGLMALAIELAGAALLAVRFIPAYGWARGGWYALFHAVSAFCNAGFDLIGGSLTAYRSDAYLLLVISALIILGGTGFAVLLELMNSRRSWRTLTLHTRIVLMATAGLLVAGTVFYAVLEWRNPATLALPGADSTGEKLLNAFFQSVTMRTAGFNSVDLNEMRDASKVFSAGLMFIGASPASTGGGVKTTTISVLFLILISVIRGHSDVNVMGKRLPQDMMRRAIALLMIALIALVAGTIAITVIEQDDVPFVDILFETASALGTVGVSSFGTAALHPVSQALLIMMMFFGRVGLLTIATALANKQNDSQNRMRYPEESMMIG